MSDLKSVGIKCEKLKMGFAHHDVLIVICYMSLETSISECKNVQRAG